MNESKYQGHTPGPWRAGFSDGSGPLWILAGRVDDFKNTFTEDGEHNPDASSTVVISTGSEGIRNPADAALIADAPLLLASVAQLEALLAEVLDGDNGDLGQDLNARVKAALAAKGGAK